MNRLLAACLAVAISGAAGAQTAVVRPDALQQRIERDGAAAAVRTLREADGGRGWRRALAEIETGDARWLAVARSLSEGTDAGSSEALRVAFANALPRNPVGVLRASNAAGSLSVAEVCSAPFIEPKPAVLQGYLRRTHRALENLRAADVEDKRRECLKAIAEIQSNVGQDRR